MTKRSTAKRIGKSSSFWMGLGLAMLLALTPCMVRAQVGSATVTGTVQDPSGAIVPGAVVTLTDTTNQTHRMAKSDSRGFFAFSDLPASTYDASFKMQGFAALVRHDIVVHIGDNVSIPAIHMRIASVNQAVTVSSESDEIVPTTSGESAYTLTSKQIQNLDIEGRSAIELLGLVPGAANSGNFNSDAYSGQTAGFSQNASAFSVNGNRFDQTQIVSDGATVTDVNTAGSAAVTPNVDMVEEAKVETAAFLPENPNGPIVVSTQTKSGGDRFHGEVYTTVRNHALNDTDWRVKNLGLPKPQDSYYYSGANIGGPVLIPGISLNHNRDKLFFFAAFEKDLQYVQDPLLDIRQSVTPTAAMRTGDFSDTAYLNELSSSQAYYATVTPCSPAGSNDSLCEGTTGFINPAAIDSNGQALINALPLPNADPSIHNGFNLLSSVITNQPRDQENLKLDYNINQRNHLSGRYNHEDESVPFPFGYFDNFTPNEFPAGQYDHDVSNSIVANLATALSNTLTNQVVFGYTRLNFKTYLSNPAGIADSTYGYAGPDLYNNNTGIIPNIQPGYGGGGYASIYLEGGSYPTTNAPQQTYVLNENVSKIYKSHIFKAGFYFAQQQFGQLTAGQENGAIETGEYGGSYNTGNAFADLLTGQIAGYSESSSNFVGHMKEKRLDFFAQDQWKVTPRFSLNYGVRVNHIGAWYEQNGRTVVFDPSLYNPGGTDAQAPGLVTHATDPSISLSGGHALGFQVAPDLGMAWDFHGNGSTILRAGFGTNYYTDPGSDAFSTIQAPPNETFTSVYELTTISAIPTLQTYLPLGLYGIGDINRHRTPTTYSYTLALAQNFPGAIHVEMAYDGNVSKSLAGFLNTNPVPEGCTAEYLDSNGQPLGYAPTTFNDVSCRPYPLLSTLSTEVQNLSSFYNSAQITASRQTGVINFWATYTYGKSMAYNCENPFNERRCYGPAPFDRSQNLNVSYLINLPNVSANFYENHRIVGEILDGWQFTGIEQLATGTPLDVTAAGSANGNTGNEYDGLHNRTINFYSVGDTFNGGNTPNFDNRVTVGTPDEQAVPTLTCDPRAGLHEHQYFNASCFQAPQLGTANNPSIGTYNLPYIHGPRSESDDIGLYKAFKITSSRRIQFRAQAFNVFNHPLDSFIQYDPGLYLTYDAYGAAPTNPTQAGYATTKLGARTIQFEGKFYF